MQKTTMRLAMCSGLIGLGLCACAQLPPAVKDLPWQDHWGDRGPGVLARDYEMCKRLVEQRSSLLEGCMTARGWALP
jgi:hypothetical protein